MTPDLSGLFDIAQIFLGVVLLVATIINVYFYYKMWRGQRLSEMRSEMDRVIIPLYNNIDSQHFFMKGVKGTRIEIDKDYWVREYYKFWDNIAENIHYSNQDVQKAYQEYIRNKSDKARDNNEDEDYISARTKFHNQIKERYNELNNAVQIEKKSLLKVIFR